MNKKELRDMLIIELANKKEKLNYNDIIEIATKLQTINSMVFKVLFTNGYFLIKN